MSHWLIVRRYERTSRLKGGTNGNRNENRESEYVSIRQR